MRETRIFYSWKSQVYEQLFEIPDRDVDAKLRVFMSGGMAELIARLLTEHFRAESVAYAKDVCQSCGVSFGVKNSEFSVADDGDLGEWVCMACEIDLESDFGERIGMYADMSSVGHHLVRDLPTVRATSEGGVTVKTVGIRAAIPPGYVLLNHRDILTSLDKWFNMVTLEWDIVDDTFCGVSCEHYIAIRTKTVIEEGELPEELRER